MNLQFSDYFLLALALSTLLLGHVVFGAAMLLGGVIYHGIEFELRHRFMNEIRRECMLAPLNRFQRINRVVQPRHWYSR
jgi:hypothetical protein